MKKGSNTISSEIYLFDDMSRLTSTERIESGEDKLDSFGYDFSSQLISAQYGFQKVNNVWVNPVRPVSYQWDKAGNRESCTDNGAACNYTANNLNQYMVAGADAVYHGSEHEISDYQGQTYGYVNDERLASIASASDTYQLAYDALGRCVKRTLNGVITYYVYDGEKPILEYNNVYQRVGLNIYGKGIDEVLGGANYRLDPAVTYYFQHDHEGSVTHMTDASGNVIESYRYDAFGAPTIFNSTSQPINASTVGNRFMFTGREYAQKFGVYEYRNRAYHPGLGRFTSEDPMGFAAGDNNLFRYCGNDPIDRVDPMGLYGEGYGLDEATEVAKTLVKEAAFAPKWKLVSATIGPGLGRHTAYHPGKLVAVLPMAGQKGYELSEVVTGKVSAVNQKGNITYVEQEGLPRDIASRATRLIHVHMDKTGVGKNEWSDFDKALPMKGKTVIRMDESNRKEWQYREPAKNSQGYTERTVPDTGKQEIPMVHRTTILPGQARTALIRLVGRQASQAWVPKQSTLHRADHEPMNNFEFTGDRSVFRKVRRACRRIGWLSLTLLVVLSFCEARAEKLNDYFMRVGREPFIDEEHKSLYERKLFVTHDEVARYVFLTNARKDGDRSAAVYRAAGRKGSLPGDYWVTFTETSDSLGSKNARGITVRRYDAPIPASTARTVHELWLAVALRSREDHDAIICSPTGIFGVTTASGARLQIVTIWFGDEDDSLSWALMQVGQSLMNYAWLPASKRAETARQIEKDSKRLLQRVVRSR